MSKRGLGAVPGLATLARMHGVQTAYRDTAGQMQYAGPEAVMAVLRELGVPLERPSDVRDAIRATKAVEESRLVEPVVLARYHKWPPLSPAEIPGASFGKFPESYREKIPIKATGAVDASLSTGGVPPSSLPPISVERRDDDWAVVSIDGPLERGYYQLDVASGGRTAICNVISRSNNWCYSEGPFRRKWGTFLPTYALRRSDDWGAGDFASLAHLARWAGSRGAEFVSTLPLFAAYLDNPFEPSPYSPVSRLFWNELYVDPTTSPEFASCEPAHALVSKGEFQREAAELRRSDEVSYRRVYALKRRILEMLARKVFADRDHRLDALQRFASERPEVDDYARFRATTEKRGEPWDKWSQGARDRNISVGDFDEESRRYHLYAQFLAHEQLSRLATCASEAGVRLMLDLPLGANSAGYDTWRERESFAHRLSCGAPPDSFFSRGQDWGFPPMHSIGARANGYRYFRESVRNLMRYAGVARIDHVAGLQRLFCIPRGMEPRDGVYIRYRAKELYAVLALESHLHGALVVGEDLGTVPRSVRRVMGGHGVYGTHVLQYEATAEQIPPARSWWSMAALNTHDMPTFAAFWRGLDIEDRLDLGLIEESDAVQQRIERQVVRQRLTDHLGLGADPELPEALSATVKALAASWSYMMLINLEDLWGETLPQNTPGTTTERVNWRRKASLSLEEITQDSGVTEILSKVNRVRKGGHQ